MFNHKLGIRVGHVNIRSVLRPWAIPINTCMRSNSISCGRRCAYNTRAGIYLYIPWSGQRRIAQIRQMLVPIITFCHPTDPCIVCGGARTLRETPNVSSIWLWAYNYNAIMWQVNLMLGLCNNSAQRPSGTHWCTSSTINTVNEFKQFQNGAKLVIIFSEWNLNS